MEWMKKTYVYIFSATGLVLVLIGGARLINVGLTTYVFTKADSFYAYPLPQDQINVANRDAMQLLQEQNIQSSHERDTAWGLSLLVVGLPLFLYHFSIIKKELHHA